MTTTASTPSADKVHQIQATTTPEGEVRFALPIKPELIESVEAIDLDLMLTTTSGEKYILQQGALLATTNTESKLVFSNGDAMSAADQMKRMGVMKPVEGGSFRLASALTPEASDKVTGNEFGLGKDAQDTVSKLEKIIQALDSSAQASQNHDSANSAQAAGKSAAFKSNADPLASPAAGTPPKPDETNTSNTSDSENQISQSTRGISPLKPSEQEGIYVSKIGDKFYTTPEKPLGISISEVSLNQTKSTEVIHLSLVGKNELSIEPESGYSIGALKLPGVKNATHVVLSTSSLPTENGVVIVKSDGQTLAPNTSYVVATSSLKDLIIPYSWKQNAVLDDGKTDAVFSIAVKFFNGTTELNYGNAPLNFYYGENPPSEIYDSNSNLRIYLSKNAYSYNITGTNDPDTINAGSGDDVIVGGLGDDKLDGSSGSDTLDYSASTTAMTVNFGSTATDRTATGTGYGATTFANIESITTGSGADSFKFKSADSNSYSINGGSGSDTLDYSDSTAAMTVNFGSTAADRTASGTDYGTTTFANIELITTGSAADTFKFKRADTNSYSINGGSSTDEGIVDTLDYSDSTAAMTVNFGSTATDRTATGTGYGTTTFANIEKISTGSAADTFKFKSADTNSYSIDGGSNTSSTTPVIDALDYSAASVAMTVNLGATAAERTATSTTADQYGTTTFANIEKIITGSAADTFKFTSADTHSYSIDGGSSSVTGVVDTLDYSGATVAMTVNLGATAADRTATSTTAGQYGTTTFANIESITTGSAADTFKFKSADTNSYSIDGGSNTSSTTPVIDTLDYSAASVAMTVNLGANAAERIATSTTAGQYGTTTFANIEKVTTGSAADTFKFTSADSNNYSIDGGSSSVTGVVDTLDYSGSDAAMTVNFSNTATDRTATGTGYGTTTFANIEKIITGSAADTFKFKSADINNYSIDGGSSSVTGVVDTLDYSASTAAMTVNFGSTATDRTATGTGYGTTTFANIESITTGSGADTFKFKSADANSYSINGGSGSDTLDYSASTAAMTVNLGSTATDCTATGTGYGTTTFANMEKIITGSGNDNITIASTDTAAYTIDAGGGNDTVTGNGASTLSYANNSTGIQLTVTNSNGRSTGAGADYFENFNKFEGGSGTDTFTLTKDDTTLYSLQGGTKQDTFLIANKNNAIINKDSLFSVNDSDTLSFFNDTSKVSINNINAGAGEANDADGGKIIFSNIKTFVGGSGGSDFTVNSTDTNGYTLQGGTGANILTGGAGADTLVAGTGNDVLNGGAGNDTLDFHTNHINLASVTANGGDGNDKVILDQDKLSGTTINFDGGTNTPVTTTNFGDTLVIWKGSSTAALDLKNLNAKNFETLDLKTDTSSNSVIFSATTVQNLVGAGNNSTLTLRMGSEDSFTIDNSAALYTQGQSIKFYSDATHTTQIAQVNFTYV